MDSPELWPPRSFAHSPPVILRRWSEKVKPDPCAEFQLGCARKSCNQTALEVEGEFSSEGAGAYVMRSAEGRQEVVERVLVRDVDCRQIEDVYKRQIQIDQNKIAKAFLHCR